MLLHAQERKSENSRNLVGSSGLEPPTSRLSGVRSNLLSYEPIHFREVLPLSIFHPLGGDERVRTDDPLLAKQVLSQLSYTPIKGFKALRRSLTPYRTSKIKQRLPNRFPVSHFRVLTLDVTRESLLRRSP